MHEDKTLTAEQFKKARAKLGFSQGVLAKLLGRTSRSISGIETSNSPIKRETKLAISFLFIPKEVREKYLPRFLR